MSELNQRARQILYAAINEYVATGEPVGSRTLAKKYGLELSPATIRNVLADLEDMGYLAQPHTSAGRVPTDRAFRLFIDALMELRKLSPDERERIHSRFDEIGPGQNVLRETGRFLSELTGTAAVVVAPKAETLKLKHLRFVRTTPGELLAVLVMSNGSVQNRFLRANVTDDELVRVHNLLDDVTEGRSLGELRDFFSRRLTSEHVQHDALRRQAFTLGSEVMRDVASEGADVIIEGQSKLLERPEFAGGEGLRQVVAALEGREELVRLLDQTMAAGGSSVVVGHEAGELGGGQLSIVGASFLERGKPVGTLGVIGPTRMDYPTVVPLVRATADAVTAFMLRKDEAADGRDDDDDDR
ncbi:MAG: heat-inducible transcriptional repressor HrcA [Polyangiaceae bacterium]